MIWQEFQVGKKLPVSTWKGSNFHLPTFEMCCPNDSHLSDKKPHPSRYKLHPVFWGGHLYQKKKSNPSPPKTYQKHNSSPQKKKQKPPQLHPHHWDFIYSTPLLGAQTEAWPSALAASLCASSSFKPYRSPALTDHVWAALGRRLGRWVVEFHGVGPECPETIRVQLEEAMMIWVFPKNSRFSPQIIHLNKVFHYFHHPVWGSPIFGNTHIGWCWMILDMILDAAQRSS